MASGFIRFAKELRRRKVWRVAAAYGAAALTAALAVAELHDDLGLPSYTPRIIVVSLAVLFPFALVLAWAFELRPEVAESENDSVAPAASDGRESIVVLPFDNMSPDPNDSYFSDGLTEEVITRLSSLKSLRVISRRSAMALKGTQKDVRTIGKELGVHYVLEGSVRKDGQNLRITAQLIDATDDEHLWGQRYDGTLEDVFTIQEAASIAIVDALNLKINPGEARALRNISISNVQAWESYLRARHELWRPSTGGLDRAEHLVKSALSIVGENPLLWATLGQVYFQRVHAGIAKDTAALLEAERCLERAFALDPNLPAAYALQAAIHYKKGELQEVVRSSRNAVDIDPDNADALFWLGTTYAHVGRNLLARQHTQHLIEIDPLGSTNYWSRAWVEFTDGAFAEALRFSRRAIELDPENFVAQLGHVIHLAGSGRIEDACNHIDEFIPHSSELPWARLFLPYKAALLGDRDEALRLIEPVVLEAMWDDEYGSWQVAGMYSMIGQVDEAFRWLRHAVVDRSFLNHRFLRELDPALENLRADPRFEQLMVTAKALWSRFEV